MEEKMRRMKELVTLLSGASRAYYQESREIMSNLEYDKLYDELLSLEKETGTVFSGSPTQKVGYEILSELPKERHDRPMLSLNKTKSVEELKQIVSWAQRPFILKGIMTARGAEKALEAGASGIVVSNHGGRVLDHCPATAEVLPDIVDAVGGKMTIFVDGAIRSGMDMFKALALGADAVLIGRPFVTTVYGGGEEGVQLYVQKLKAELADTMRMCGAHSLADIDRSMLYGF